MIIDKVEKHLREALMPPKVCPTHREDTVEWNPIDHMEDHIQTAINIIEANKK